MADANNPTTAILDNIKSFYNDDSNKTTKIALALVAGSLLAYTTYAYSKSNTEKAPSTDDACAITDDVEEESKEDIARKKAAKLAKKKKKVEVQKIIDDLYEATILIVDAKGWNIKYFMSYYGKVEKNYTAFLRYQCQSCKNICRDCVEIEGAQKDEKDPIVMCEVCAMDEGKKYKPYKAMRKIILKENIILPDPHNTEAIQFTMKNDRESIAAMTEEDKSIFKSNAFWGRLSKCVSTKIPQIAEDEYKKRLRNEELSKLNLEKGVKDLDWKFHDDSNTKEALFIVSEDGLRATTNKRSGTVFFGPFINALQYKDKQWIEDYSYAGNVYKIELQIRESDGCAVGFCQDDFNQFIGKNEGNIKSLMLNQSGWFYTSSTFKHEWQHMRESPMGKWFKSEDIIVVVIDCTDAHNVKGEIYNKANQGNKFEIEKLPKKICIAVNVIVGSNPTGSIQPGVSVVSATVERV